MSTPGEFTAKVYVDETDPARNRVMVEMPDGKYVTAWTDEKGRTKSVEMRVRPSGTWQPVR